MNDDRKNIFKKGCLSFVLAIIFLSVIIFALSGIYKETTFSDLLDGLNNFFY
ncbi:MAG: hypothetical protein WBI07_17270 [Mobilitalea sp.]